MSFCKGLAWLEELSLHKFISSGHFNYDVASCKGEDNSVLSITDNAEFSEISDVGSASFQYHHSSYSLHLVGFKNFQETGILLNFTK